MSGRVAQRQNAKRTRKKGQTAGLLLVLLAFATSGALLWAAAGQMGLAGREFEPLEGLDSRAVDLPESPFARFGAENALDALSYRVNQTIEMATAASPAPLCIGSPIQNSVLFRAEVILDQSGESIFSSGFLLPGSQIEEAPLSVALKVGEYAATVWFYAADPEDESLLGRTSEPVTITVLS